MVNVTIAIANDLTLEKLRIRIGFADKVTDRI